MNGWRDMKTSPPAHGEAVIATDGAGGMWAGRVEHIDALPDLNKVVGANLHTGKPVQIYFDELTRWAPILEMVHSTESADAMFRKMGYTPLKTPSIVYENDSGDANERIIAYDTPTGMYFECLVNGENQGFFSNEILACAQLAQEHDEAKK